LWWGEEAENCDGNDPVVRSDEREQFISRGTDAGESRSRVGAVTEVD
jgi:hypothetical protein